MRTCLPSWQTICGSVVDTPRICRARRWRRRDLGGQLDESYRVSFNADGKEIDAVARSLEHLLEICDVVRQLLAASVLHSVVLRGWDSRDGA
jgi:hypothetical protein